MPLRGDIARPPCYPSQEYSTSSGGCRIISECGDEQRRVPPCETLAWQTTTFTVKMMSLYLGLAMCTQESLCMPGWGFSNIMFAYQAVGAMIWQADLYVPTYIHVYSIVGINCQLLL